MKVWAKLLGIISIITLSACLPIYHMQTPETVPPRKVQVGIGGTVPPIFIISGVPAGIWVRTGITPKIDVGFNPLFLGLKMDGKFNVVKDYLAVGAGAGYFNASMWDFEAHTYILEGSLYLGYPGNVLYPYGAARITKMENTVLATGPLFTAVGGLRIQLLPLSESALYKLFIYVECGWMHSFGWVFDSPYYDDIPPQDGFPIGLGISIGG